MPVVGRSVTIEDMNMAGWTSFSRMRPSTWICKAPGAGELVAAAVGCKAAARARRPPVNHGHPQGQREVRRQQHYQSL